MIGGYGPFRLRSPGRALAAETELLTRKIFI